MKNVLYVVAAFFGMVFTMPLIAQTSRTMFACCSPENFCGSRLFDDRAVCIQACPGHNTCQARTVTVRPTAVVSTNVTAPVVGGVVGGTMAPSPVVLPPVATTQVPVTATVGTQLNPVAPGLVPNTTAVQGPIANVTGQAVTPVVAQNTALISSPITTSYASPESTLGSTSPGSAGSRSGTAVGRGR